MDTPQGVLGKPACEALLGVAVVAARGPAGHDPDLRLSRDTHP